MMGIIVPETCWANISSVNHCVASSCLSVVISSTMHGQTLIKFRGHVSLIHNFLPTQTFHSVTKLHCNFLEHYLTFDSSFTIHDPAFNGTSFLHTLQDHMTNLVVLMTRGQNVLRWHSCKGYAVCTVLLLSVSVSHIDVSTFKHGADWQRHTSLINYVSEKEWLSFQIINKIFPGLQVWKHG